MVSSDLPALDTDRAIGRVDGLDGSDDHVDPSTPKCLQRPGDLVGSALSGHHPEVGGREREVGVAVDQDDPVAPTQAAAQPVGSRDPADAAAENHNGLGRAAVAIGH
jgi:hypothetical protein